MYYDANSLYSDECWQWHVMADGMKSFQATVGFRETGRAVFEIHAPQVPALPFVYNSPHSGRHYPADLMALTSLDVLEIRGSEDCFVDLLFGAAPGLGASLLQANYPRAYVDTNREPYELDPDMFVDPLPAYATCHSSRISAGLGTIPKVVSPTRNIYRQKLSFADACGRIERVYAPYHQALGGVIDQVAADFGGVILIDCHSMPSPERPRRFSGTMMDADVVLGDRYGRSCAPELSDVAERLFRDMGYTVRRNEPYAGGYNVMHYGNPARGRHALQVEICRSLYVNEATLEPNANFDILARDLQSWMSGMHAAAAGLWSTLVPCRIPSSEQPKAAE